MDNRDILYDAKIKDHVCAAGGVMCRDCKHWEMLEGKLMQDNGGSWRQKGSCAKMYYEKRTDNDFCSRGERK